MTYMRHTTRPFLFAGIYKLQPGASRDGWRARSGES